MIYKNIKNNIDRFIAIIKMNIDLKKATKIYIN